MGTKIEWADEVWNPVTGCSPVSPACDNCYAKRMAKRLRGRAGYPDDDPFKVTHHFNRLDQPFKYQRPRRVFVCSMGDLFHGKVKPGIIIKILSTIDWLDSHTFIILTKRPWRMKYYIESFYKLPGFDYRGTGYLIKNLWLGVTAENQQAADERVPILLQIPAAVRFVSVEPMLGPVDIATWLDGYCGHPCKEHFEYNDCPCVRENPPNLVLDWVIAGAETGPGARVMHPGHVISLYDQCKRAEVPFFFKKESKGWPVPDRVTNTREFPGDQGK